MSDSFAAVSPVSPTRPESRVREQLSRRLARTSLPPPIVAWRYRCEIPGSTRAGRSTAKDQRWPRCLTCVAVCRRGTNSVVRRPSRSPPSDLLFSLLRNTHTLFFIPRCHVHGTPASETRWRSATQRADGTHTNTSISTYTRTPTSFFTPTLLNRA